MSPKGVDSEVKRAIDYALALGWTCRPLANSHFMLMAPDGVGKVTVSATPSKSSFVYRKILGDIQREIKRGAEK